MKSLFFAFIFLSFILISYPSFSIPRDVEKLSGSDYFSSVNKALTKAKKSIFFVMYYIDFGKSKLESKVFILVDDLVKAKDRCLYLSNDRRNVFQNSFLIGGIFKF